MAVQLTDEIIISRLGIVGKATVQEVKDALGISEGYTPYVVWAEESSQITANSFQYSYGNGDIPPNGTGALIPFDCDLVGLGMTVSSGSGCRVKGFIDLLDTNRVSDALVSRGIITDVTPFAVTKGQIFDFQTFDVGTGVSGGARAWAIFAVPIVGLVGATGKDGIPGNDGLPSAIMRIPLTGQSDVNGTDILLNLNAPTINTIAGASVVSSVVNLPSGNYKVTLEVSLNSAIQRTNIGFTFLKDNAFYSRRSGGNYIRRTSGHDEAGDSVSDYIDFSVAGNLRFQSFSQAALGVVNLDGVGSRLLIQKLS